jgi:hypothetical protein
VRWSPLSGIAFVGCFAAAVVLFGSGAGSQPAEIASYYASSGDRGRQIAVEDAGFVLFVAAMLAALGFVVAASVAALRTGALHRVLAIVGFPVAVSLAASWYYLPVFALLAWVAAASVFLIRGTQSP